MDIPTILALRVVDLKQKLNELNLPISGRKQTLQDRLLEYYNLQIPEVVDESGEEFIDAEQVEEERGIVTVKPSSFTLNDVRESVSLFYGTGLPRIEQWLQEFEDNAAVVEWSDLQKFIYAKQLLKGAAQLWLRGQTNINSWTKLKKHLENEFGNKMSVREIHKLLEKSQKKVKETNLEFLYKIIEKAKPLNLDDESIIEYFIAGIPDSELNKTVLHEATTITELKEKIRKYERIKVGDNRQNSNRKNNKCDFCPHLTNHSTEECRKSKTVCYNCNKRGHKASACRENRTQQMPTPNMIANGQQRNFSNNNFNRQNRNNNDVHNNEVNRNRALPQNNYHRQNTGNVTNRQHEVQENAPTFQTKICFRPINIYKEITIKEKKFPILFDTGSDCSFITKSVFDSLGYTHLFPETVRIFGVGHGDLKTLGYIIVTAQIDDIKFNWRFHIVNDADVASISILGSDILQVVDVNITKDNAIFWLREEQIPLEDMLFNEMLGEEKCGENFILGKEFRALCLDNDLNTEIDFGPKSKMVKNQLISMIRQYKPIQTKQLNIETKIILTDDVPVAQKRRPLSFTDQKIVEKQINEWLAEGIIRPSESEYAAPIVLTKKKNGTKRLCCDYRKLNEKTVRDNFPMVLIDDVLNKLEKAKIFTTLDLKNGYFHVPVERNSQKYTAFVTHHGQYEFLKTPFGIKNAPAVFCRFIAAIFHEFIQNDTIIVYMDDIVIPSQTVKENLEKLSKILKHASEYGLQINFDKCQFVQEEISFLGYIIKNSTMKPSTEKVSAVTKFPEPTNVKTLQRFLGLTSYFRRFIRDYALMAKPLTDLLKKDNKFKFNDTERIAFEQLKMALINGPVLNIFNPHADTEIHTDASMYGFGAALLQKNAEDSKWHPIQYMSRKTTETEQKYHSYELEVLAIINALKKWKLYVMGIHIKIITDCHAFTQTVKKTEVPGRIARWILFLEEFDYEIEHRAGSRLKHVDALSRVHCLIMQNSLKYSIIEVQKNDEWTNAVRQIVIREKYKDFYLKNDVLYKDSSKELIVIPSNMEREIIEIAHRQGHLSIQKTIDVVQKDFYIPKITEKVTKIVKSCVHCIISSAKLGKKEGMLNPIDKSNQPLDTYHIDHVGPLEKTHKQYNHILAIIDAFSKFVWLYPTKSTTANEVVNILKKQAIIFGNPARIITDRGTAFTAQIFEDYCKNENIQHHLITTGVPRGNGQIERVHKTVITLLTKLCSEEPQNWYKHVEKIQQTLNNTVSRSTKRTPFRILTGLEMKITGLKEIRELLTEEEINELEQDRDETREEALKNIQEIQEENRSTYNRNRKPEIDYQIGDMVAIKRTQFGSGLKLKPKYLGPYKVTKKKLLGRYEVEKLDESEGPKKTSTIAEFMKPWNTDSGRIRCQDSRM